MLRNLLSNGLVAFAGIVSLPALVTSVDMVHTTAEYHRDPRLQCLQRFFEDMGAPIKDLAVVFLEAADDQALDWRLLPSLSFVESTGGKYVRHNNLFGWDSGRAEFPSMSAAIRAVAWRLANSKRYRDKDLDELLRTYNPEDDYPDKVKSVMDQIGPSEW